MLFFYIDYRDMDSGTRGTSIPNNETYALLQLNREIMVVVETYLSNVFTSVVFNM